jgi:hypothetical protein
MKELGLIGILGGAHNPGMRFRKLRIAWSVFCGLATVLLIALWARSYYWFDAWRIDPIYKAYSIGGQSGAGCFVLDGVNSFTPAFPQTKFRYRGTTLDPFMPELPPSSRVWGGFSARIEGRDYFSFCVPYWFLVLAATTFAGIPWLPWWSSRFSLRTLLIATTLVAVVLGVIVWATR